MSSIILYCMDTENIQRTIDEIIDKTPKSLVDEIIVCDDSGSGLALQDVEIILTNRLGRAKAWNMAAKQAVGKELVFLGGPTKLSQDWLPPLLDLARAEAQLVTPVVHALDTNLWASEDTRWNRFGWRWDLGLFNRGVYSSTESPAASSHCMVIDKEWFEELGGFDDGMIAGNGEDIELSLRSWLFGGKTVVCDDSIVSGVVRGDGTNSVCNYGRIVEAWMPEYSSFFYRARGIDPVDLDIGRIGNLLDLKRKEQRSIDWFLQSLQPELLGVPSKKGSAAGRSVAVVGSGPSMDYINPAWVNRHDIVIGVDYMGVLFDCDYVVTDAVQVVVELRKKYDNGKFVLPLVLENRVAGEYSASSEIVPGAVQFEAAKAGEHVESVDPPLMGCSMVHAAVHFALCLDPASVTLFGCDNKIIGEKSHTTKIEYYGDGRLWTDSEAVRRRFAFFEYNLDQLGQLAIDNNIPLVRVGHV